MKESNATSDDNHENPYREALPGRLNLDEVEQLQEDEDSRYYKTSTDGD